jgi:predicted lactoylglutathione lyase
MPVRTPATMSDLLRRACRGIGGRSSGSSLCLIQKATTRHWCFKAKSQSEVDAFWRAGIAAGGADDGPPGLRHYHASYYGAFLRDPDGNKVEAVCHHPV